MPDFKNFISPISIDLGAKNTGVYFAHYPEGSSLDKIEKTGKVYQLKKNSYTLLMAGRTAARHQRRGHDRRQLVKKLFKLIWEEHLKLPWNKNTQQTISFLFNRRGFTFLNEEYEPDILKQFPEHACKLLPKELKTGVEQNEKGYDFDSALIEWSQDHKLEKKIEAINAEPKRIKNRLFVISRINKLKEYCNQRIKQKKIEENKNIKIKLSELPKWTFKEWIEKEKIKGLPEENNKSKYFKNSTIDLVDYLNDQDKKKMTSILESLPNTDEEDKKLKNSHWNFKLEKFNLEKAQFSSPDNESTQSDNSSAKTECLRTHLQHLAFALDKTYNELKSGSRHRSTYFKEVEDVLKCDNHSHGYLKRFCRDLHSGKFKFKDFLNKETLKDNLNIEAKALSYLISHLSNLELKPLRKYFNDKKHRKGVYWDEARLAEKFENWILREWRVNLQKDKKKAQDKQGDYEQLKNKWKKLAINSNTSSKNSNNRWKELKAEWENQHKGKLIKFFLNTDPFLTIPPYQDSNNRRPPKCQTLVLNVDYLNNYYPEWHKWLDSLKALKTVKDYLGDYENQLKNLKSSGQTKTVLSHKDYSKKDKNSKFSYFGDNKYQRSQRHLKARILQFIFDRAKNTDLLQLNTIYSHAKKFRQTQSTQKEKEIAKNYLEKAIKESRLSESLKTDRNYHDDSVIL